MPFAKNSLQRCTGRGNGKSDPNVSYSVNWRLSEWTGDALPTFADVFSHLRSDSTLPWFGRKFKYREYSDNSAICVAVEPEPADAAGGDVWDVRATYESLKPEKQEQPDGNGEFTEDVFKWRRECSVSWSQTAAAIEKGTFRGFSRPVGNPHLRVGRVGPLVNSAIQPFDVQHMREEDWQTITIAKHVPKWDNDDARAWIGAVNDVGFNFTLNDLRGVFRFPQRTLKVRNFGATSDYINGKECWRQQIELVYRPDGWRLQILDTGFSERRFAGDHKPDGTLVSNSDVIQNGKWEAFKDENDYPAATAHLLDGNGQRLPPNAEPVYLIYQIYERERNFQQLEKLF